MKRFYCTVCQRIKRVRSLPKNVANEVSENPSLRVGHCDKHDNPVIVTKPVHSVRRVSGVR